MLRKMQSVSRSLLGRAAVAAALLAGFSSLHAQDSPRPGQDPPSGPDILVTGTRDTRGTAEQFVDAITVETDGQVARFDAPVCPASLGLPPAYNNVVVERIRSVARLAGARVAEGHCVPNVLIITASDALDFTHALHSLRPRLFEGLKVHEIQSLMRGDEPAKAWQIVETRGRDGRKLESISFLEMGGKMVYVANAHLLQSTLNSRIGMATRQDLTLSVIVIGLRVTQGRSLQQLADYAAMRTLARTRPPSSVGRRHSILTLFQDPPDGRDPEEGLTAWDRAYLQGVYAADVGKAAGQQRLTIARLVRTGLNAKPDLAALPSP
jgi:hypothetical protein